MSAALPALSSADSEAHDAAPFWRWAMLTGLLLFEILWLTLFVDAGNLAEAPNAWPWLISFSPQLLRILLAAAAALLLLADDEFIPTLLTATRSEQMGGWLVAHLACYAALVPVCQNGFHADSENQWRGLLLTLAVSLAAATGVCWLLALVPLKQTLDLVKGYRWQFILASLAGGLCWLSGTLSALAWPALGPATLRVVVALLRMVYSDIVWESEQMSVGTTDFHVSIAPQCSGYEGMGMIAVFMAMHLSALREQFRFPQALLLVPLAMALAWIANCLRIAVLIAIGTSWSSQIALGGFHSQAGWLTFIGLALGLAGASTSMPWLATPSDPKSAASTRSSHPVFRYLAPLVAYLAARMLIFAVTTEPWMIQAVPLAAAAVLLYLSHAEFGKLACSMSPWPVLVGLSVACMWLVSNRFFTATSHSPAENLLASPLALGLAIVSYGIFTPLVEELAFRGYLLRRLCGSEFDRVRFAEVSWLAVIVSSVLFGLLHSNHWIAATLAGLTFAWVASRSGRLGSAVACHATANLSLAGYALLTGDWQAWS